MLTSTLVYIMTHDVSGRHFGTPFGYQEQPMARKIKPVPTGYRTVTPYLVVRGADEAIAFYEAAFGAKTVSRHTDETGLHVLQAEIKIGNAIVLLCEEAADYGILSPAALGGTAVAMHVYLPDPDAVMDAAMNAGAHPLVAMHDTPYGERFGKVIDPFGHVWALAMRIALPTPEAMPAVIAEKAAALNAAAAGMEIGSEVGNGAETGLETHAEPPHESEAVSLLEPAGDIREEPIAG